MLANTLRMPLGPKRYPGQAEFQENMNSSNVLFVVPNNTISRETSGIQVSASRFASALVEIGQPGGNQLQFIRAHYDAPGRAATATRLAQTAGYKNHGGINLCYGRLAESIRARLRPKPSNTGLSLLVDLVRPSTVTNRHWVLVMRPEFAEGLKRANWVL